MFSLYLLPTEVPRHKMFRSAEELAQMLLGLEPGDGDTMSPWAVDFPERPEAGYCVALSGTDLRLNRDDNPTEIAERIDEWQEALAWLFGTHNAWLGMWHNDETNTIELNVTVVTDYWSVAQQLGKDNNQFSVYDIEEGECVDMGGNGGEAFSPEAGLAGVNWPTEDYMYSVVWGAA